MTVGTFHDLTLSSSVATRHSPCKLGSALAAPSVPARRGSLPLRQEGLSQRGRGTLRRGSEDGPAALQDLRPQDAGELGGLIPILLYNQRSIRLGAPLNYHITLKQLNALQNKNHYNHVIIHTKETQFVNNIKSYP